MTGAGAVYGQALYDLAKEEGLEQVIYDQLIILDGIFADEPEYLRLLGASNLPCEQRLQLVEDCFGGKVALYLNNFLKLLTQRGHISSFSECVKQYREQYNIAHNILPVKAITAVALSDAQKNKLEEKLCAITGKVAQVTNRVDPSVLGGVRLDYDGTQVDDTVENRMNNIRRLLENTVL
jgi:F-type H+-transporting ATPase subunit delta